MTVSPILYNNSQKPSGYTLRYPLYVISFSREPERTKGWVVSVLPYPLSCVRDVSLLDPSLCSSL